MTRAERRHRTATFIESQLRIARSRHGNDRLAAEPGRLKKRHAMDCGRPLCGLCGNPRRTGQKHPQTIQELRFIDKQALGFTAMTSEADSDGETSMD